MRRFYKAVGFFILVLVYAAVGLAVQTMPLTQDIRRFLQVRWVSKTARAALRILGLQVTLQGPASVFHTSGTHLFVSNHLSYIDILVVAAQGPVLFISSVEMGRVLLLGWLAHLGGTFFVERRSPARVRSEMELMARFLGSGISLCLFPEGTTGDGSRILPIKSGFLSVATQAGVPIQPLCLNYAGVDGRPLRGRDKDDLFWYGRMTFFRHFWRVLKWKTIHVSVTVLPSISPARFSSQKDVGLLLENVWRQVFVPVH